MTEKTPFQHFQGGGQVSPTLPPAHACGRAWLLSP